MTLETWIMKGGIVDATSSAVGSDIAANIGTKNLISSLAEAGYTGTLTARSGGTPAFITVSNKTSKLQDLEKLIQIAKAANCGLTYTQGA